MPLPFWENVRLTASPVVRREPLIFGSVRVLLVSVAVAESLVASEVLSTLVSPTSPLTIPVGVVMAGEVRDLLVRVWVPPTVTTLVVLLPAVEALISPVTSRLTAGAVLPIPR